MSPSANSQKGILWSAIILTALFVGYGIFGKLTDNGSGLYVLGLLFYAFPTFLIVGILSFIYLKNKPKTSTMESRSFTSKSVSAGRVLSTIMILIALAVVGFMVYWFVDAMIYSANRPDYY
jgi:hypothetical protein